MTRVHCALCRRRAVRYFLTLNNALWAVCDRHTQPFRGIMVELDPEEYDIEGYFAELEEEAV